MDNPIFNLVFQIFLPIKFAACCSIIQLLSRNMVELRKI
jgi:hypothetical protein